MNLMLAFLTPTFFLPLAVLFFIYYFANKEYKKTSYYQITHLPLLAVRLDIGRNGEYLTYKYLKKHEENGAKFLFNVYVPKENGETSEIDVMMIHQKGIFVFESKNYSGWIFGSETQRMWTQTLPAGKGRSHKEAFYNPIMQNQSHINHLKVFLDEDVPTSSVIVFSERCTLKNIQIKSKDIYVINRNHVAQTVNTICNSISEEMLNDTEILNIYNRLYPFTQVDETTKEKHINNIQKQQNTETIKNSNNEAILLSEVDERIVDNQSSESPQNESIDGKTENISEVATEIENSICPRCGGKLLLRTAMRGSNIGQQFYGCANYPKCRYIHNVSK